MGSPSVDIKEYGTTAEPLKPLDTSAAEIAAEPHTDPDAAAEVVAAIEAAAELYAPKPQKVTDLIKLLADVLTTKGDLQVSICVFNDEDNSYSIDPVVGHYFQVNDNKEAQLLVLCDANHLQFAQENMELEDEEIKPQGVN